MPDHSAARQSPPVSKNPLMIGGHVQGTLATTWPIQPALIKKYVIACKTKGAIINGMPMIGFKTTGNPNMTGSEI